jgi:hypothetical protein
MIKYNPVKRIKKVSRKGSGGLGDTGTVLVVGALGVGGYLAWKYWGKNIIPTEESTGTVNFTSIPAQSKVYLNDSTISAGHTPLTLELDKGNYNWKMVMDNNPLTFKVGSFSLTGGETKDINVDFSITDDLSFDLLQPIIAPSEIYPGTLVNISCPIKSKSNVSAILKAIVEIHEGSVLPGTGNLIKSIDIPDFQINIGETKNITTNFTEIANDKTRRDIVVKILKSTTNEEITSKEFDDAYTVKLPSSTFRNLSITKITPSSTPSHSTVIVTGSFEHYGASGNYRVICNLGHEPFTNLFESSGYSNCVVSIDGSWKTYNYSVSIVLGDNTTPIGSPFDVQTRIYNIDKQTTDIEVIGTEMLTVTTTSHIINYSVSPVGSGLYTLGMTYNTESGNISVPETTSWIDIDVSAKAGYAFDHWGGSGVEFMDDIRTKPNSIKNKDCSLIAYFVSSSLTSHWNIRTPYPNQFSNSLPIIYVKLNGTVSLEFYTGVLESYDFKVGDNIVFQCYDAWNSDIVLDYWELDGSNIGSQQNKAFNITDTIGHSIKAIMKKGTVVSPITGMLHVSFSPSNSVVKVNGENVYNNQNYELEQGTYSWTASASGFTSKSGTVTIQAGLTTNLNISLAEIYTLSVTASPSSGGTVSKSPSKSSYNEGEVVTLTAHPSNGYVFSYWSGIVGTPGYSPINIVVERNTNIMAVFVTTQETGPKFTVGDIISIGSDIYTVHAVAEASFEYILAEGRYPNDVISWNWVDSNYIDDVATLIGHVYIG